MPSQLLRGPAVLFAAVSYLLFSLLLKTSKETQLCLLALGLGSLLTVLDWAAHIQQSVLVLQQRLQEELHSRANAVVLDDVLRTIFAPDTGWIATICGTWIGTAGMYALPLDAEQRVRLFGSGLAEVDGTLDAREVLLRPGGLLRLLPERWSDGNSTVDSDSGGEGGKSKSDRVPIAVASVGRSVRWEDEPEPVGTMDDSMEEEDDSVTADATDEASDSSASSNHSPLHHDDADITRRSASAPPRIPRPSTTRQQQQQQDPATVAASVLSELLGKMLDRSLASVDQSTVQTVGMASALTLALQLRRSPRARSALWTMAQGAAALGLAGTAVGALAISEAKRRRRRERDASTAAPTTSSGDGPTSSCSTPTSGATSIPMPTLPFTLYESIPPLNEVINDGQRWFRQFMEVAKSPKVIRQLLENPALRRRLKGFAAVLVMMYFRRRRNHRIAQQRPMGGAGLYS